jgi:hypothetical protein
LRNRRDTRHGAGDPAGYALAVNINRRHLKASARHLIAEMARRQF